MATILSFANQKGGTGKTQCTVIAATALKSMNKRVLVIDADEQRSITTARGFDEKGAAMFDILTTSDIYNSVNDNLNHYDYIFIDLAGRLDTNVPVKDQRITKALMIIDFVFIPFVAGNYNLESTLTFLKVVRQIERVRTKQKRHLQVIGFVNMYQSRSKMNDFLIQDIEDVKRIAGIDFMRTPLKRYTAFSDHSTTESLYKRNKTVPAQNLTQWINELKRIIS